MRALGCSLPRKICPRSSPSRAGVPDSCRWSNRLPSRARNRSRPEPPGRARDSPIAAAPQRSRAAPPAPRALGALGGIAVLLCIAAAYVTWTLLPLAVVVVEPHRGAAVQAVYATGTVEPSVMVPISPRGMARLVELKVDEGSVVEKGQLLARLENDDLQRAIIAAAAEEHYAKTQLDRQAQLIERGVAARSAYDRARPIGRRQRRSASAPRRRHTTSISSRPPPARSSAATARSAR